MSTVGAMLKAARKKLGMSREVLAAKIGVGLMSGSTIKRVEVGAKNVSPEAIEAVASALGFGYDRARDLLETRVAVPGESIPETLERVARQLLVVSAQIRRADEGDGGATGQFGDGRDDGSGGDVLGHHARRSQGHGKAASRATGRASRRKPK